MQIACATDVKDRFTGSLQQPESLALSLCHDPAGLQCDKIVLDVLCNLMFYVNGLG